MSDPTLPTPKSRLPRRFLRIGDAVQLYGLTPRTLRHYEEFGLIRAHRDARGFRIYDDEARGRLEWIVQLRRGGMSLPEILCILDQTQENAAQARHHLERLETNALAQLEAVRSVLKWTEQRAKAPTAPLYPATPSTVHTRAS